MINKRIEPDEAKLRELLRNSRPTPPLPPGFQAGVWRRIARAEAGLPTLPVVDWLDRLAGWLRRPRLALAGITAMLVLGMWLGVMRGLSISQNAAKERYLAAVNPNSPHP